MRRSNNLVQLTWILVIVLLLVSLFAFISCADDIVNPRFEPDENPDGPKEEEEDPNQEGGGGSMVLSQQIVQYV